LRVDRIHKAIIGDVPNGGEIRKNRSGGKGGERGRIIKKVADLAGIITKVVEPQISRLAGDP